MQKQGHNVNDGIARSLSFLTSVLSQPLDASSWLVKEFPGFKRKKVYAQKQSRYQGKLFLISGY